MSGALPGGDERFSLLLDTLPYSAFLIGAGSVTAHYNAHFVAYVGFQPGVDAEARAGLLHPEDRPVLAAARAAGRAADADYVVEARLRRHDGVYRWHRIHNKPLFEDGRRVAWLGTAVDVDDARRATELLERRVRERTVELESVNRRLVAEEARYRDLYNRTPMALQSSDAGARLVDVNDTWVETFGVPREDALGRSMADFMTAESAAVYRERAWPGMLASGGQVRVVDYAFVARDGRVFDGRVSARGVFGADGRLVRTWAAIADVTAEKRAGEALQQAQRMDAVGQLTAGIAHDFNNLLTAILGNLELAARPGMEAARQARLVAGARSAAERGARLTAQLLAFARQQRIAAEAVDVVAVLVAMGPLLSSTAGGAIEVEVVPAPGLPLAMADVTQLELAVLNLVINARDALSGTEVGSGRITVELAVVVCGGAMRPEEPEAGRYVGVTVRDTGPGMPEGVQARMFEPFFTTKGAGRGSGLGLAQVLGIAKQLGGGVRVQSDPGRGTAVTVLLPVTGGEAGGGVDASAAEERAAPAPVGRRILLVDDDDDVRATTALMLADAGHVVVEAVSGAAALALLEGGEAVVDLVVADVAMPGMSGPALAAVLGRTRPGLPVLLMTGYADSGLLPAGAGGDVLQKPFGTAELSAWIARSDGAGR